MKSIILKQKQTLERKYDNLLGLFTKLCRKCVHQLLRTYAGAAGEQGHLNNDYEYTERYKLIILLVVTCCKAHLKNRLRVIKYQNISRKK